MLSGRLSERRLLGPSLRSSGGEGADDLSLSNFEVSNVEAGSVFLLRREMREQSPSSPLDICKAGKARHQARTRYFRVHFSLS